MKKKLSDLLARVSGKSPLRKGQGADSGGASLISNAFVKAFNRCPICEGEFVDHYFTLLSVIPAWKVDEVTNLVKKVQQHQWAAAREVREFDPAQDALAVYVLRCPGKRLAVLIVDDPYDLDSNPGILESEVLDGERSQGLKSVLGDTNWVPIRNMD